MKTRKDPNYIAAVEKAITEKYGKDTVQDFRNEWKEEKEKEYLNQLKEMRVKRDKYSTNKENGKLPTDSTVLALFHFALEVLETFHK